MNFTGNPEIVVFGCYPLNGGVPRRLANIMKVWVSRGFRVQVVGFRGGRLFYPDELRDLVSFVDLGTSGKVPTLFALWRHLRRTRPKVILSTAHAANMIVAALAFLPGTGTKRFSSVPNTFGQARRGSRRQRTRKLGQVRRFYKHCDGVIAISRGVRDDLVNTVGLRDVPVHCIFNGSVSDDNLRRGTAPVQHPWLARPRHVPVVISVGRLAPQKDQRRLLEAIARIRSKRECRLIILGEGPLRSELEQQAAQLGIAESLDLPGFVDNPYAWVAKADCFVLCSLWEGFPNVLAEALGLGVPTVSTDCPSGPADILQDGRFGKLVPMRDSVALANAIEQVLDGDTPQFELDKAVAEFTAERSAQNYLRVFGLLPKEENR